MKLVVNNTLSNNVVQEDQTRKKRFQLAKLLRDTETMLVCAQKEDWDTVEEMESLRRDEINDCFKNASNDEEELPVMAEALATLTYLNEQIVKLVHEARADIIKSQNELKSSKSAVKSYQAYQEI